MKLTGQMIYEAVRKVNGDHVPWRAARQQQGHFNAVAEALNTQIAEHQTQPLPAPEQQYTIHIENFGCIDRIFANALAIVEEIANAWLEDHPGAVLINTTTNTCMTKDGETVYIMTLVVELPVEQEGCQGEEERA